MQIRDIKFSATDPTKTDIDCADGEIAIAYNLSQTTEGAFSNSISPRPLTRLPKGFTPIAIHETNDAALHLIATDSTNQLYWSRLTEGEATVTTEVMVLIGSIGSVRCVTTKGDYIIIGSDEGINLLLWNGTDYLMPPITPEPLSIDFGLQKAGNLVTNETIVTDAETTSHITEPGSGASRPHPSASESVDKVLNIGKSVATCFQNTLAYQVSPKGYFYQPFFISYALRLFDGTHIMASSPILMLPTTLPPTIGITTSSGQDDKTYINIDLTTNNYFELRYRINGALDSQLREIVTAIDIYASLPIPTYQADKIADGYITSFKSIVNTSDSGGFNRGRHYPSRGDDESTFLGHYSLGNDNYTDHTIEGTNNNVWYVSPNPHFQDDIMSEHEMFLISSIPVDTIRAMPEFETLDIVTSFPDKLLKHDKAVTDVICLQHRYKCAIPTTLTTYGQQLIVASSSHKPIPPLPINAMCAYSGNAAAQPSTITITVYSKANGRIYKSTKTYADQRTDISNGLPRYIFHPDPDAFMMSIRQGSTTCTFPLTMTSNRRGSYWWGGLKSDLQLPQISVPTNALETPIASEATIYVSDLSNPLLAHSALSPGCEAVTGFASAMLPPVGANFGQYPLYTFTLSGIWLLQYDDAKYTFTNARMISDDSCVNHLSITSVGNAVIYATDKSIKCITGSKITSITHNLSSIVRGINNLPHINDLLSQANAKLSETTLEYLLAKCSIIYDTGSKHLIIAPEGCDYALIKAADTDFWSIADMHIRSKLTVKGRDIAVDVYNNIVDFDYNDRVQKAMLITRPIKLEAPINGKNITRSEILGYFKDGHVHAALYGSDNLIDWHLMSSSMSAILEEDNGTHYRYLRIVIISNLTADEYLYGTQITYSLI